MPSEMLSGYLERISLDRAAIPSSDPVTALRTIHRHHCLAIPFENLSLSHAALKTQGTPPTNLQGIHRKLVQHKRGGWCYEHNGLLSGMLTDLGFDCYEGLACVVKAGSLQPAEQPLQGLPTFKNKGSTIELGGVHKIVFVRLPGGELFLADTGFGGQGLLEPLPVRAYDDGGQESVQAGSRYRLRRGVMGSAELLPSDAVDSHPDRDAYVGWYLQAFLSGVWADLYYYRTDARSTLEFEAFSTFDALSHPLFTSSMVVTRPMDDGRASLLDMTYKVRRQGQETEVTQLQSEEERDELLQTIFEIDLTARV